MADSQGTKHGPVLSPMASDMVPGGSSNMNSTGGGVYNGIDGYPKGTPTKMPEIAFDKSGSFGSVKPAKE